MFLKHHHVSIVHIVVTFRTMWSCALDTSFLLSRLFSSGLINRAKTSGRIDAVTNGKKKKGSEGLRWVALQQNIISFWLSPLLMAASIRIASLSLSSNFFVKKTVCHASFSFGLLFLQLEALLQLSLLRTLILLFSQQIYCRRCVLCTVKSECISFLSWLREARALHDWL